ncbi:MAG TPA: glycosyltransferase family 4 protein [bacterium]|nr:glycosyltransferase family 4 protein [bacterium]
MKVLIISETFPPLIRASARIMKDLAVTFVENGHEVSVVTFIENHNEFKHITTGRFEENGYDVIRVKIPKQRGVGYFRRGITEELIPFIATRKSLNYLKNEKFDLIVAHLPPLSICSMVKKLKKINNCPVYLLLRDIHPQTGVDLGIYKLGGIVFSRFRHLEKKLYEISDVIAPQSPANREFILKNNPGIPPEKVSVIYNFKNPDIEPTHSINFKDKLGLNGKMVCLYGGNMTSSQDLKELLMVAQKCRELKDVVFLMIGFGKEREMLNQKANEMGLTNIIFEDPLPLDVFTSLVYQCDIGLMFLNKNFTTHNFPGKTLDYMNASLPIIASVNEGNDLKKMIESDANCGFVHYGSDLDGVAENIKTLSLNSEKRKTLGKNGRIYLEKELNSQIAYDKIMSDINKLKGDNNA